MENLVQQQSQNQSEYQNNSISIHLTRRRREHDDDDDDAGDDDDDDDGDDDDDDDGLNILGNPNEKMVPITPSVVGPRPKRRWNSCPTSHGTRKIHISPATVDHIFLKPKSASEVNIYLYASPPPKPTFSVDACIGNNSQQKWRLQNAWVLLRRLSPCRQQRCPPVGWRSVGQIWWYCCQGHCTWSPQFHLRHWWESFSNQLLTLARSGSSRKRPSWTCGALCRKLSNDLARLHPGRRPSHPDRRMWYRPIAMAKIITKGVFPTPGHEQRIQMR